MKNSLFFSLLAGNSAVGDRFCRTASADRRQQFRGRLVGIRHLGVRSHETVDPLQTFFQALLTHVRTSPPWPRQGASE
jgi:hypothetical protein